MYLYLLKPKISFQWFCCSKINSECRCLSGCFLDIEKIYFRFILQKLNVRGIQLEMFWIYVVYILLNLDLYSDEYEHVLKNNSVKFEYVLDIYSRYYSRQILWSLLPYDSQRANKARAFLCISSIFLIQFRQLNWCMVNLKGMELASLICSFWASLEKISILGTTICHCRF